MVTCPAPSVNVTDGRCPQRLCLPELGAELQRQFSVGVIAFHEKAGRSQDRPVRRLRDPICEWVLYRD